jgi:hypothetical protein
MHKQTQVKAQSPAGGGSEEEVKQNFLAQVINVNI